MTRSPAARRAERGSATAEFALVLPLILLVVLALAQVAALLRDQQVLAQAAREGARAAAVDPDDSKAVAAVARVAGEGAETTVQRSGGGGVVTVAVGISRQLAMPLGWFGFSPVRLSASATMREEYAP